MTTEHARALLSSLHRTYCDTYARWGPPRERYEWRVAVGMGAVILNALHTLNPKAVIPDPVWLFDFPVMSDARLADGVAYLHRRPDGSPVCFCGHALSDHRHSIVETVLGAIYTPGIPCSVPGCGCPRFERPPP